MPHHTWLAGTHALAYHTPAGGGSKECRITEVQQGHRSLIIK